MYIYFLYHFLQTIYVYYYLFIYLFLQTHALNPEHQSLQSTKRKYTIYLEERPLRFHTYSNLMFWDINDKIMIFVVVVFKLNFDGIDEYLMWIENKGGMPLCRTK